MATARCIVNQSVSLLRDEFALYACSIKETTNGCWRCACRQTRKALEVIAQGRLAGDVQINEQSGAAQDGQDQAQETAEEKATIERS